MKNTLFALVGAMLLLLTACNTNDPTKSCPVAGRTYAYHSDGFIADTIYFYSNGQCRDVMYLDEQIVIANDLYYLMQDTTITLYWDKHHKELSYIDGTFFYHDTLLIRWVKNDATSDDYDKYFEIK